MLPFSICRISLAATAALMLVSPVAAYDQPFHVEGNLGQAHVDDIDGFPINDASTAFRLATGYSFQDWLGVAGAFVDLGTVDGTVDGPGAPVPIEASADGFEVTLFARFPLTETVAVAANAGVLWWTSDSRIAGVADDDSGNDSTWGLSAEYALRPTIAITAGWRRYTVDDVDADVGYMGVRVRFGDVD